MRAKNESISTTNTGRSEKGVPVRVQQVSQGSTTGNETGVSSSETSRGVKGDNGSSQADILQSQGVGGENTQDKSQGGTGRRLGFKDLEIESQESFTKSDTPSISHLNTTKEQIESEKAKYYLDQNHLILGFTQKLDTPLASIHNLASQLNDNLLSGLDKLVPNTKSNKEQQEQVENFLAFNKTFSQKTSANPKI